MKCVSRKQIKMDEKNLKQRIHAAIRDSGLEREDLANTGPILTRGRKAGYLAIRVLTDLEYIISAGFGAAAINEVLQGRYLGAVMFGVASAAFGKHAYLERERANSDYEIFKVLDGDKKSR